MGTVLLNLNDLQLFVKVVDHGGFTAASRALQVPKQTLSKRIAELERLAGVRLIQRTSRSFTVTDLGLDLYRHAAAMVVEAEAAETVIQGRLAEPSGVVRITASVPTVQMGLAALLPRVAAAFPRIQIVLDASDRFVDVVQEGYDIALRTHLDPLPDSGLVQRRIQRESIWLVAAPATMAGVKADDPDAVSGLDGIFQNHGQNSLRLQSDSNSRDLILRPRYVANESTAILSAARAGLGVAALPASMCKAAIGAGQLRRVCSEWTAGELVTTLLMPHRRGLLPSVRVVADLIAEEIGRQ